PYDYLLEDSVGRVRVQVKLQRKKGGKPMMASQGYKWLSGEMFAVETQKTRGGKDPQTKEDTRPYRFGEFDVLAVSMEPSVSRWDAFMFTVAKWLLPRPDDPNLLLKFQPVSPVPNEDWTDDFNVCVAWLRSGNVKTIGGRNLSG
ncbi:MAG: hypothetical protein ACP5XB_07260, partial [Isosphaeraceae bacterium]